MILGEQGMFDITHCKKRAVIGLLLVVLLICSACTEDVNKAMRPRSSKLDRKSQIAVAPLIRAADRASCMTETASPPMAFDWGQGVFMSGLLETYQVTKDPRYLKAVQNWGNYHSAQSLMPKLKAAGFCNYWGPGAPMIELYKVTGQEQYLKPVDEIWQYIRDHAARTTEGALGHSKRQRNRNQLWVDSLYMTCPTLAKYSNVINDPAPLDDAVRQLELAAKYLQDKETGLFLHMWDEPTGKATASFWGRGNGWVIISLVDVLEFLPKQHPKYDQLVMILNRQINGLIQYQSPNGMWHTVIDRIDSYQETSATAMITYAIAKAMQLELISEDYKAQLLNAWQGLSKRVNEDGVVTGASLGTLPYSGGSFEYYDSISTAESTWGTGSFLRAGAKLMEMGILTSK